MECVRSKTTILLSIRIKLFFHHLKLIVKEGISARILKMHTGHPFFFILSFWFWVLHGYARVDSSLRTPWTLSDNIYKRTDVPPCEHARASFGRRNRGSPGNNIGIWTDVPPCECARALCSHTSRSDVSRKPDRQTKGGHWGRDWRCMG